MRHRSRRCLFLLLLLVLLALLTALAGQAEQANNELDLRLYAPAMTPGARDDLQALGPTIPRYTIMLQLDWENASYSGTETVFYINNGPATLNEIYFRLYPNGDKTYGAGALTVTAVSVDGRQVQPTLELGNTALRVPLSVPLAPEATAAVTLTFAGRVPRDFASAGDNGESYGIFNYTQDVLTLANWYPLLAVHDSSGWRLEKFYTWGDAVTSAVALYDVTITAPDEVVLITSGTEICREPLAHERERIKHRYVTGPMRDFVISASPRFKRLLQQVDETVISSYYLPGHELGGRATLAVASNALQLFEQKYGRYPYAELDVVETPLPWPGGVEYPGVVLISDKLYYQPDPTELNFAMIVSHEIAHQWWYGVVGNDVIREPWLDEALATYSSGIYIQTLLGADAYFKLRQGWQISYEQARTTNDAPITAPLDRFTGNSDYYGIVYCGGALFYEALRAEIGDAAFFAGLQNYYRKFKYRLATTEDLLETFQEVTSRDLGQFYANWLSISVGIKH